MHLNNLGLECLIYIGTCGLRPITYIVGLSRKNGNIIFFRFWDYTWLKWRKKSASHDKVITPILRFYPPWNWSSHLRCNDFKKKSRLRNIINVIKYNNDRDTMGNHADEHVFETFFRSPVKFTISGPLRLGPTK